MSVQFPSDAWVTELMQHLNSSPEYQSAAANWEGDFAFVVSAGHGVESDTYLYMDLWHGECRSARMLDTADDEHPAFTLTATVPVWKLVLTGKLDPIKGLMQRRLGLKGNLMRIMKAPKAAVAMVNCAMQIDTDWPE